MHAVQNKSAEMVKRMFAYLIMLLFTVLTIGPLVWLFYSSFKPHAEIARNPLALPVQPTLDNFRIAWTEGRLGLYFLNSIFYSSVATGLTVVLALAAAFGFAKLPSRIGKWLHHAFVLGMLITVHSTLVPLFLVETRLGIDNTRFGIILPYIGFGLPFSVYLATAYIKSMPDSVIEAAVLDGAGYLQIFRHIILPMAQPIVSTLIVFIFLANWNEFVLVFTLTSKDSLRSLPVGINAFAGSMVTDYGLRFAALTIGTAPMILFYLLLRKKIREGFSMGAVEG
jgi:raffinose/stachyose/melibiose transport system permease protein